MIVFLRQNVPWGWTAANLLVLKRVSPLPLVLVHPSPWLHSAFSGARCPWAEQSSVEHLWVGTSHQGNPGLLQQFEHPDPGGLRDEREHGTSHGEPTQARLLEVGVSGKDLGRDGAED